MMNIINMQIKAIFYNKTTLLPSFNKTPFTYRTMYTTLKSTYDHSRGTHVTLPQRITIIKRFMFRNTVNKGKECIGDHCKEALQGMTTVNPNQTATPPVDNAASNLQKKPDSQNTPLPLTEITQPMTPPTTSQDMPQSPQKLTKPTLDPAIEYGLPVSTQDKITKVSSSAQEQLSTPLLDQLKKDGFNLTEQSSINSDEHSYSVFEESPTYQGESVEDLNPIIGINLCTVDPNKKNHTPEQRHINVATIDKEGVATSSSYVTSSKGHSKEKHNHGVQNNPRISNEKINGHVEYVSTTFIGMTDQGDAYTGRTPVKTISPDNEDGSGCVEESKIKDGQFLRVLHNAMEIKKEDYTIDERATVYLNQPEVFSIVAPIHEKALTKSTSKDIYDPNTTTQNKTPAMVAPSMNTNETTNNIENAEEID